MANNIVHVSSKAPSKRGEIYNPHAWNVDWKKHQIENIRIFVYAACGHIRSQTPPICFPDCPEELTPEEVQVHATQINHPYSSRAYSSHSEALHAVIEEWGDKI